NKNRKNGRKIGGEISIINHYIIGFLIYIMMIRISLSNNVFSHHHHRSSNDKNYAGIDENKQLELSSSKDISTKSITFNELCPIWSKKLSLGLDRVDKFMIERDS